MKIIISIIAIFQLMSISSDEYWHLNEYLNNNPTQEKLIKNFEKSIKANAIMISTKQKKKIRIVLIYPDSQVSDYWRRNILALEKRLMESQVEYDLKLIAAPKAGVKNKKSEEIIEEIKKKPDYLIFTLNIREHSKLINQILSYSDIKVILLNITTPLKTWGKNQPFFYVGFDHEAGTQKLVDEIKRKLPNGGVFLVLYHSKGYVSRMRGDFAIRELLKTKKWNLVSRYYTDADTERVKIALDDFFKRKKKVDLIVSCSTDISIAAQKYKKNTQFLLNGWGGGTAELNSIKDNINGIDFTVMRINDDSAIAIAEAIKLDVQGESKKIPQIFSGEMVIINKETSLEDINLLEKRAFRYSNEKK